MDTTNNTVYINNLSYNRNRSGITSIFAPFGSVKNVKIIVEPTTNQSRGMAFVEMATAQDAKRAIQGLNGQLIDGRTVKAKAATPNKNPSRREFVREEENLNKKSDYVSVQLMKKARNEKKRKANPLQFKAPKK